MSSGFDRNRSLWKQVLVFGSCSKFSGLNWIFDLTFPSFILSLPSIFSLPSYGPTFLLRHRLSNRLQFLQKDDQLLLKASKEPASSSYGMPTDREILAQAAGERGLRASGRSGTELRESEYLPPFP